MHYSDRPMKSRDVHLQYRFEPAGQRGSDVDNPLFDLLSALAAHGSIQQAAAATGRSYRHIWGGLRPPAVRPGLLGPPTVSSKMPPSVADGRPAWARRTA